MVAPAKPKMGIQRAVFAVHRQEGDGGAHTITIAANDVSRNPFDEIRLEGGMFENYMRNPVVLWGHDQRSIPIGKSLDVRFEDGFLKADFEFLPDDDFAARVQNAWERGFVNAASISFMPMEIDESDKTKPFGVVSKWELLEWSLVTVPADPDALRAAERELDLPDGTLGEPSETARLTETVETLSARLDELKAEVDSLRNGDADGTDDNTDDNDGDPEGDDERALREELAELAATVRAKE